MIAKDYLADSASLLLNRNALIRHRQDKTKVEQTIKTLTFKYEFLDEEVPD